MRMSWERSFLSRGVPVGILQVTIIPLADENDYSIDPYKIDSRI